MAKGQDAQKADKKKYPTLNTFIDSQMKYKQSQNKT